MSKDKQIEEMANDLENHTCMSQYQAEIASRMLYAKGYRKASEVAREIIADIEKIIEVDKEGGATFDVRELFKIEKKYTEGERNES